tara:strand:- start:707 stop:1525 length:819 start_codon:yes stop_codon:yes gene_type:complete
MNFVTCNVLGPGDDNYGLGNQMFNAAATLSHAKDTEKLALFPCLKQTEWYGDYCKNIFRNLDLSNLPGAINHVYKEQDFSFSLIPNKPNILLEGYFQSEKYFNHNKQLILDTFTLPDNIMNYINIKYSRLLDMKNTVSVHIRRGDYISHFKGCFELLDNDYYDEAFNQFPLDSVFVFFGENPEDFDFCKRKFSLKKTLHIQNESDIIDLFLMSRMKNNIIANSSFSWWAAWLNINKNKKIIAPQKWFGKDHPTLWNNSETTKDLIPERWTRI